MKKLIHIDNYESFYLDYLEGTLSEAERNAFEEFLAAHPELQVDEDLLILDDAPEKMDPLQKLLLKKEDLSGVTSENLDYFAIGKVEQVLSENENKLFDSYLSANPEAQKVLAAYEETRLKAPIITYPNKEDLKEKEIAFVSWKLIVGISSAAAILLLFFQLGFNNNTNETDPNTVAQNDKKGQQTTTGNKKPSKVAPSINMIEENSSYVAQKSNPDGSVTSQPGNRHNQIRNEKNNPDQLVPVQPEAEKQVAENKPHHPTILPEVKDNKQPVAPTLNEEVNKAPSRDLASNVGSSSNMKNPIPIITNTISEKTKTPVDFKTGKATETEKGGFFIKIGKFEVSHKSSKRK